MGENSKIKDGENIEAKRLRRKKQALGARVYAAYCCTFGFLMTLSFLDLLPGFETNVSLYHYNNGL